MGARPSSSSRTCGWSRTTPTPAGSLRARRSCSPMTELAPQPDPCEIRRVRRAALVESCVRRRAPAHREVSGPTRVGPRHVFFFFLDRCARLHRGVHSPADELGLHTAELHKLATGTCSVPGRKWSAPVMILFTECSL